MKMKSICACCNSSNIRVCTEKDVDDFDKGTVFEHVYVCNDCQYSGVLDVEDWK